MTGHRSAHQPPRTGRRPEIQVESRQKESAAARSLRTPRKLIRIVLKPNPSFALLRNFAPAGCRQPSSCHPAKPPCLSCPALPTAATNCRRASIYTLANQTCPSALSDYSATANQKTARQPIRPTELVIAERTSPQPSHSWSPKYSPLAPNRLLKDRSSKAASRLGLTLNSAPTERVDKNCCLQPLQSATLNSAAFAPDTSTLPLTRRFKCPTDSPQPKLLRMAKEPAKWRTPQPHRRRKSTCKQPPASRSKLKSGFNSSCENQQLPTRQLPNLTFTIPNRPATPEEIPWFDFCLQSARMLAQATSWHRKQVAPRTVPATEAAQVGGGSEQLRSWAGPTTPAVHSTIASSTVVSSQNCHQQECLAFSAIQGCCSRAGKQHHAQLAAPVPTSARPSAAQLSQNLRTKMVSHSCRLAA